MSACRICWMIDDGVEWGLMPFSTVPGLIVGLRTGNPFGGFGATALCVLAFLWLGEVGKWVVRRTA